MKVRTCLVTSACTAVSVSSSNGIVNVGGAETSPGLAHAMEPNPARVMPNTSAMRIHIRGHNKRESYPRSIPRKVGIRQDAQKGQTSHPPNPGVPRRALPKQGHSECAG